MENYIKDYLTNINKMKSDNIFKLDYNEQSLKNNLKFNSWKNIMLQKYGNDVKCSYDGLYFHCINESFRNLPLCSSIYPSSFNLFVIIAQKLCMTIIHFVIVV